MANDIIQNSKQDSLRGRKGSSPRHKHRYTIDTRVKEKNSGILGSLSDIFLHTLLTPEPHTVIDSRLNSHTRLCTYILSHINTQQNHKNTIVANIRMSISALFQSVHLIHI